MGAKACISVNYRYVPLQRARIPYSEVSDNTRCCNHPRRPPHDCLVSVPSTQVEVQAKPVWVEGCGQRAWRAIFLKSVTFVGYLSVRCYPSRVWDEKQKSWNAWNALPVRLVCVTMCFCLKELSESCFFLARASFMTKTVQYQNELHKFLIWDTAGQERVSDVCFLSCFFLINLEGCEIRKECLLFIFLYITKPR